MTEVTIELFSRLDKISELVGEGTDYFWPKFISYEMFMGYVCITIAVLLMIATLVLVYIGVTGLKERPNNDVYVLSLVIAIGTSVASCVLTLMGTIHFCNPDVCALERLLNIIAQ